MSQRQIDKPELLPLPTVLDQNQGLDRLLQEAATERDRAKFHELIRKINRLRAERWLTSGLKRPGVPPSSMDTDSFGVFSGPPERRDAARISTIVGIDCARADLSGFDRPGLGPDSINRPEEKVIVVDDQQEIKTAPAADKKLLTRREREVLQLLAEGHTCKGIAAALRIGEKTVETHRTHLKHKIGCRKVADLVRYAIRNRITIVHPLEHSRF